MSMDPPVRIAVGRPAQEQEQGCAPCKSLAAVIGIGGALVGAYFLLAGQVHLLPDEYAVFNGRVDK